MKNLCAGIDLGTSNSALAVCGADSDDAPRNLEIPQLVSLDRFELLAELPSVLYIAPEGEARKKKQLPWEDESGYITGQMARDRGAEVPDRVVTSAKSWLCYHELDPGSAILPWESEVPEGKVSPFLASRYYLQHLKNALQLDERVNPFLENVETVLTVPASFDEVARSLTVEAAAAAGLKDAVLLEEPLAAFYHWLSREGESWRKKLKVGDLVLVCDVGGGTADFTLILVEEERGDLSLRRISVGRHILLGGDNMDLALAFAAGEKLKQRGQRLDRWQFSSLIHSVRSAKERLFREDQLNEIPVVLAGKSSSLFGSAVSTNLSREELNSVVVQGFVPLSGIGVQPAEEKRSGLVEQGLPYASDPALTHHLAAFLVRSAEEVDGEFEVGGRILADNDSGRKYLMPNLVLFNGGVFNAAPLRNRVRDVLLSWSQGNQLKELESGDYASAVAKGAAVFARMRVTGRGVRVRAGLSRSYYAGLERAALSAPGYRPPLRAVCVAAQGMEEGTSAEVPGREFVLLTGTEVKFRFFSGQGRTEDESGSLVDDAEEVLESAMEMTGTILVEAGDQRKSIPVHLRSVLSDVGLLELWMEEVQGPGRWKLELNTRVEQ